jgi:RHS repeat-associated protein
MGSSELVGRWSVRGGLLLFVALWVVALVLPGGAYAASCTDTWTGGAGDGLWASAGNWSTSVPGSGDVACIGSGVTVHVTAGSNETGMLEDQGSLVVSGGSLAVAETLEASSVAGLTLSGGALSVAGTLDVSGSFSTSGTPTVSGPGELVLGSGVTGVVNDAYCSGLLLEDVTFVNHGTLMDGASGGAADGSLAMKDGAEFENSGTFDADSWDPACGYGYGGTSFENAGGAASSITNTGTFQSDAEGSAINLEVGFTNDGTVSGTGSSSLAFHDGGGGTGGTWSAASGATLTFASGSFAFTEGTWSGLGTMKVAGGSVTATSLLGSSSHVSLSGGSLTIPEGSTTSVAGLTLTGGTLSVGGQLEASGSLSTSGTPTIGGSGELVVGSEGTAAVNDGSCSSLLLEDVTFVNHGTLMDGASGGAADGAIAMKGGAQLQNSGTFDVDSYDPGCGYGYGGSTFENAGGATSSVINTGTFQTDASGDTINVRVAFDNDGGVVAQSGELDFHAGGIAADVAVGSWETEGSGAIVLSGGEFLIAETVDLSDVRVEGATVTREPVSGPPRGSLNPRPYASDTVTISGTGESVGSGFSAASIEVAPAGTSEWKALCGPLTPGLDGSFGCEWNTASGSYPDGHYQLRGQLSDSEHPPDTAPTTSINTVVDNTPPTGSVSTPGELHGPSSVSGSANDSGSGVASWQLQIAAEGSSSWANACAAQSAPVSGSTYRCTVEAFSYTNGAYQLRAVVTDNAGNTYTTATVSATVDNIAPSETNPPVISGTAWVGRKLRASTGVWAGTQPLSYTYQWEACDSAGASCSDISGATSSTFSPAGGQIGSTLRVTVTASNPMGSESSTSGASAVVTESSCTDTWTGPGEGGEWRTASDWSTGSVPGSSDLACVDAGVSIAVDGGTNQVGALLDEGTLVISSGSLELANASDASSVGALTISGGTLTGAGRLTVSGSLSWTSGTMSGSGATVVLPGATATVRGWVYLAERQLVNEGTATFEGRGWLYMSDGAQIKNAGTFKTNTSEGWDGFYAEGGAAPSILNTGTFEKVAGGEETEVRVAFENEGGVESHAGHLEFRGGGSGADGDWSASEGGRIEFVAGSFGLHGDTLSGAIDLSGGSVTAEEAHGSDLSLQVNSGTLNVATGWLVAADFTQTGGTVEGGGTLDVSGVLSWTGGTMSGSGSTVILPEATGTLKGGGLLAGRQLVNEGMATLLHGWLYMSDSAQLKNTGTFETNTSEGWDGFNPEGGASPSILNSGTFEKVAGSQETEVRVRFENEGSVESRAGHLEFRGGGSGADGGWSASEGGSIEFVAGSYALRGDTLSGAIDLVGGRVSVEGVHAHYASVQLTSGSLSVASGGATTVGSLTQTGGSITGAGTLDVSGALSWTDGTMSGSGATVVLPGASATIKGGVTLAARELVNEGTTTLVNGGAVNMSEGAQVDNVGVFETNTTEGWDAFAFYPTTGGMPSIVNTGTFEKVAGSQETEIRVNFTNDGRVVSLAGSLEFTGGGVPGEVSGGTWNAEGGTIVFKGGTFAILEGTNVGAVETNGTTLDWVPRGLMGSLGTLPSYVSGTVKVSGSGEGGISGPFAGASVEVASEGGTWVTLCGSLTPGLAGEFECSWETASGSYPDGIYQLRAKLSGGSPTETLTTNTVTAFVDNTPPTGSLTAPASGATGGFPMVMGTASDSESGVASWQLQIAPEGSSEWASACAAQTSPLSGDEYGCVMETAHWSDGSYRLRALISDQAGNTYLTSTVDLQIDNAALEGSLTVVPSPIAKTVEVEGAATGPGVESWALQIAPAGGTSWSSACPVQSTPVSGSTYGCSFDSSTLADGDYQLRAVITGDEGHTRTTAAIPTIIDNTAPTGAMSSPPSSISGSYEGQGHAEDSGSGVASWTLQLAPAGSETWTEPCLAQTLPVFGDIYGCTVDTSGMEDGDYKVRAVIVDNAGNTYTTPAVTLEVKNTPPSSTAAPAVSGVAIAGRTLSATTGTWSGPAPITYDYQWQRCNTAGESCANIEGASGSTYMLATGDIASTVRVVVTASNGAGSSSASSPASAVIAADTLANISLPAVGGSPHAGGTQEADPGEWSGALPISYAYQWQRCNSSGAECANITGASTQSFTPTEAMISSTLRVTVTASNSEGSLSETSAVSPPIAASAGSGIRYLYDKAGRLSIVDDPSKGAAVYQWDPDGNLLSIERYSQSTLAVLALRPEHAPPGTTVDITGTGFNPDAADDTVTFDGTGATVTEASATDLIVTVPSGTGTGKVTVTVSGESASSGDDFAPDVRRLGGVTHKPLLLASQASAKPTASEAVAKPPAGRVGGASRALARISATGIQAAIRDYKPRQPAAWDPTAANRRDDDWVSGRAPSPWANLSALTQRGARTTALSGQALITNGLPLANVKLTLQGTNRTTRTDRTGRFLLTGLPAGHQVLIIDGEAADHSGERYGQFTVGVELTKDKTTPLGYTIWMTPLDPAGNTRIQSPLKHETTITNPKIPGLEVRLPAGTVVRGASGAIVHKLNLTAVPLDRPPFPLPPFISGIPTYFTVQPGRAYLNKGAQIIYPNWGHLPPGQRVDFWNYDPSDKGWYVYGKGSVSANGKQVIPDSDVRVWEFTGAMISGTGEPPLNGPVNGASTNAGDPVDLATGLFVYQHTDLDVPDSMMPVSLTRTYREADNNSYSFGIGTASPFDLHLWSDENYKTAYLVLPDGGKVKLIRTSAGSGYVEAEYKTVETPGEWEGATMHWDTANSEWILTRRDGMKFIFGEVAPLQAIEDRNGNRITLVREGGKNGPIVQIRTPHGHWIDLSYDSYNRITLAVDNSGQAVKYEYNSAGYLIKVTDPLGRITRYAYGPEGMTSVIDAGGHTLISNTYRLGKVTQQTVGGVGTYHFSYIETYCRPILVGGGGGGAYACHFDFGTVVNTPGGVERTGTFSGGPGSSEEGGETGGAPILGVPVREVSLDSALSQEEDTRYQRNAAGNITKIAETATTGGDDEESSSATTKLTYDDQGDATSITHEAPSQTPLSTSFTYNAFSEPTSETDPQGQTAKYAYDTHGNLTSVTDPIGHQSTFGYDSEGELTSATDPEGNTSHFTYEDGREVKNTDPLGHETHIAYNGVDLPTSITNPEGQTTEYTYDQDNELTSETDPAGEKTSYTYDPDGNLASVTDPRGHTQTGTYNTLNELASWTDALGHTTSYVYDDEGRLQSVTDPKGQTTSYTYNPFYGLASVSFGATGGGSPTSSIGYSYDTEGNLSSAVDSRGGTYTMSYGAYHRLTGESGPDGSIGYSYDLDGQRTGMSVDGETAASYAYNEDGQLTGIETPHGDVSFAYDPDGRTAKTTLPDGDTENYAYDSDSQLTATDYEKPGGAQIGDLQYGRDALGRLTTLSGSLARTDLPEALGEATYNAANELTSLEGHTLTYDADGNLTSTPTSSYTYDDRNQLTGITQGSDIWGFAYDPFGRRSSKTLNGTATSYLYDSENPVSETTGDSTAQLLNGLGLNERFARTTGAATSSYLTNEQNSTIALANSSGEPTTEYTYLPFGADTTTGEASSNPYQYAGYENDGTGLLHDHARYYNPATVQFTTQDPTGMAGSGVNLYQYAGGDPVDYSIRVLGTLPTDSVREVFRSLGFSHLVKTSDGFVAHWNPPVNADLAYDG